MYDFITPAILAEGPEMTTTYVASVVITGIVVVFLALILLIILFSILGYTVNISKKEDVQNEAPTATQVAVSNATRASVAPVVEDGIDEEVVAVIMAAISAMSEQSGKKLRLLSVKSAGNARPAWAQAGLIDNTRPF